MRPCQSWTDTTANAVFKNECMGVRCSEREREGGREGGSVGPCGLRILAAEVMYWNNPISHVCEAILSWLCSYVKRMFSLVRRQWDLGGVLR